jgi:hypothetical protein
MGRKNNLKSYNLFENGGGDMSADFDTFATPTNIDYLDNAGILLNWDNATTPVGVFEILVSKDKALQGQFPTNWNKLEFGNTIAINGTEDNHIINMNQLSFSWLAVKYTRTSGSGTLGAVMTVKMVGG